MSLGTNSLGVDRARATSHMTALHKAHATGKYWRAIHCCREGPSATTPAEASGKSNDDDDEDAVAILLDPLRLSRSIDRAYHEASDTLLRILLGENGLLGSLRFMKKYFLLDQGDFLVNFLDGAEEELSKDLPSVLRGRVQNWLSTSIARTESESSQLASALRCTFQNKSLRDTLDDLGNRRASKSKRAARQKKVLTGFEAIAFEFRSVPFPTSIVLSHDQLRIYQVLFRLIFFAKHVERQLVNMWSDHQLLRGMTSLRSACSATFSLRRRMLHFIQNYVHYMQFDVVEPGWRALEERLSATRDYMDGRTPSAGADGQFPRTVDDLVHDHNEFLIRISHQCLLPNYDLIDRASKIMTTCLLFSNQIKLFMETTKVHDLHERTRLERSRLRYGERGIGEGRGARAGDAGGEFRADRERRTMKCADRIQDELSTERYRHMITRFDEVFSAHLAEFLRNLNSDFGQKSNAHLTNLFLKLDYNGYCSETLLSEKKQVLQK